MNLIHSFKINKISKKSFNIIFNSLEQHYDSHSFRVCCWLDGAMTNYY